MYLNFVKFSIYVYSDQFKALLMNNLFCKTIFIIELKLYLPFSL